MRHHPVQMKYTEAIDWLYSTQQFGIKLGLEQPRRLLEETLSLPAPEVKVVHVAGTNGKGSTCAMIDSLLRAHGIRSGFFSSPHLVSFTERIQVNGSQISEETVARHLTTIRHLVSEWENHPTFFEITLALGMSYFREQGCEMIVLETGMGGRLDATTAVPADVAVITPIAMDHSQWLGETLAEVAMEKAGIIVPTKPVVCSKQEGEAQQIIEQRANELASPVEFITEPLSGYSLSLPGRHQFHNAALALAAVHRAGITIDPDLARKALKTVHWPGRFEKWDGSPTYPALILDAAHNPHAAKALVATWQEEYPDHKASVIFGGVEGKNTAEVLRILATIAQHIHLTPVDSPRSLSKEQLQQAMPAHTEYTLHDDLTGALSDVTASEDQVPILVCGSIFMIGQLKGMLTATPTRAGTQ